MASVLLAYNASGGSGTGYAPWGGSATTRVAVTASGWTPTSASAAWWMSPDYTPGSTGVIGVIDANETVPVAPWTWSFQAGTATPGAGIMSTDSNRIDGTTTRFYLNQVIYGSQRALVGNSMSTLFTNTGQYQIRVEGVGTTPANNVTFNVTAVSLNGFSGGDVVNVSHVSGTGYPSPLDGQTFSISARNNALPATSRSRGTIKFYRVGNIATPNEAAALAVYLGLPGVTVGSTLNDIKTAALAQAGFWVSW